MDQSKILLSTKDATNNLVLSDNGSVSVAAITNGIRQATATIPHGLETDDVIPQVTITPPGFTPGTSTIVPYVSNDGRIGAFVSVDSTNLYITAFVSDASGFGSPSGIFTFSYKLVM